MTIAWNDLSPADFDRAKMDRRHKRPAGGQDALFFTATPAKAARPAALPAQLPGQVDLFTALADAEADSAGDGDAGGCEACATVQAHSGRFLARGELTDIHSVDHACPACESREVAVTGTDEHGLTRCECRTCPAVFAVSFGIDGPIALRYVHVGHRAR